jgi:hypothetical protein
VLIAKSTKHFRKLTKIEALKTENSRLRKSCEVLIHMNQRLKTELSAFLKGANEALTTIDPKPKVKEPVDETHD